MINRERFIGILLDHDKRESKKKSYNPYAMGQYLQAFHRVEDEIDAGITINDALSNNFCGRLLEKLLKAI